MRKKLIFLTCVLMGLNAQAGLLFVYSRLATKDLDQMNKIVREKIKESRKEKADKTVPLKEALQAVFSRPNEDFMIEKVLTPLKAELEEQQAWQKTVNALVKEAKGALKNTKAFRPDAQVTYIVFLENIVGEFRPRANEDFEKSVLEDIKKADIQVSKEAQSERKLRMMRDSISPSKLAEAVLESAPPKAAEKPATEATTTTLPTSETPVKD
jgi:Rps23 Pro-64 3,4-dihydroxylase Tpa1-like proline 4-hydroxylase